MNLTIERVKELLISQKENNSLQYQMAQDIIELHERVAELKGEIDDWKLAGYKK